MNAQAAADFAEADYQNAKADAYMGLAIGGILIIGVITGGIPVVAGAGKVLRPAFGH